MISQSQSRLVGRWPWLWGVAFGLGLATIAVLERAHIIHWPWNLVLMIVPILCLFPLGKAAQNQAIARGAATAAMRGYNRRMLVWSLGYVAALGIALTAYKTFDPQGPELALIALLPSLSILHFVWVMGRYLVEEQDEYQRSRQIHAGLIATGILLFAASFWGFLETFGVVPHVPGWAAVPVWAIGLGLGHMVLRLRDPVREPS